MKRHLIFILLIMQMIMLNTPPAHALWWMVYHKPAFKGKVIDAETKEPIEGAVVVAVYEKATMGLGAGALSSIINVREVLTDKKGMFRISSYTTIIQPFSVEDEANFIIFKPGYGSFPDWRVSPPKGMDIKVVWDDFFTGEVGIEKEVWWSEPWKVGAESKKIKVTFGIVELPKLKTREERNKANMISPTDDEKQWPLLHEMIKKEDEWLKNNNNKGGIIKRIKRLRMDEVKTYEKTA